MTKKRKKNRNMKKTKAKVHTILEKKLDEIEDLLNEVVLSDDTNLCREIEFRLIFAKTLLTAEISSRQTAEEGGDDGGEMVKLARMAQRLMELEEAFINQWTTGQDSVMQSLESVGDVVNVEKTGPVCSCDQCCPKDEDCCLEKEDCEAEEEVLDDHNAEECTEKIEAVSVEEMGREAAEKKGGFRVVVVAGIMGFFVGIMSFFRRNSGDHVKDNVFLAPT